MKKRLIIFFGLIFLLNDSYSQSNKYPFEWNKGQFYFNSNLNLLASQIDGDNAAGYNKIAAKIAVNTGFTLNKSESIELSIGLSERGSRKGIDPENLDFNIFHIRMRTLDIGFYYNRVWKGIDFYGGIVPTYLLSVADLEGFNPNIQDDYRNLGCLLELGVKHPIHQNWSISLHGTYSAFSMINGDRITIGGNTNINPSSGAYSNSVGLGIVFHP